MKDFISGIYMNQGSYKSFQPNPINRDWTVDDMEVIHLLSRADMLIGTLNAHAMRLPDPELYIGMHIMKESTQSTKIEGTETNIQEALQDEGDILEMRMQDWVEVQNYSKAMRWAIDKLQELPLATRLIRESHKILLKGVRGQTKLPGEFRRSQNWVGGATLQDARFVPPVHTTIHELMSDLEKFIHNDDMLLPPLLKVALVHYQFETIHPFLDGNGRVGRLLIPLYLIEQKILTRPVLYLSDFFEKNRTLYYDNLTRVREANDIKHWFKFFLVGVIETAKEGISTFEFILKLKEEIDASIQTLGLRSDHARKVMEHLYQKPIIDAKKVVGITNLTPATAYKLIADLERLNILYEITGGKRGRNYVFLRYLDLFR